MSLENAKVLHKHFLDKGMLKHAKQQEVNYPELKEVHVPKVEQKPKEEPKEHGKKSKR